MATINAVKFDDDAPEELTQIEYGNDWPVVYVISGKDEAYVGETVNAAIRASQHLANPERRRLNEMNVISDSDFNKSVILDLESYLIKYMSSDGKFKLQNSNKGMQLHNYYDKLRYEENFAYIWNQLKSKSLAIHSIADIENSDLFKYSPYKALSFDQFIIVDSLVQALAEGRSNHEKSTLMVQGSAGTGKTVLAVYLTKLLTENAISSLYVDSDFDADLNLDKMTMNLKKIGPIKVGLVIPMQSLRKTITKVFGNIRGLTKDMVVSPIQVPKEHYDLLIVDEAHRLRQRKALSQYPAFDKNNRLLGFDNTGTELDWIMECSDNQLFFYDSGQSVKPSDIDKSRFDDLINKPGVKKFKLTSQFRCEGGNDYIDYVRSIFSDNPPLESKNFGTYDLRLFDDVEEMVKTIKAKDAEFGLCRTVAGYSWKWKTKNKAVAGAYDIEIDGHQYLWNSDYVDWVNTPNSINEIGCIHTIQGYDLNYAGVIIGNEIKYNRLLHQIEIDKTQYQDLQGKTSLKDDDALKAYIANIYVTLMTRGIKGTYVYACDDGMREYLRKFIL